MTDSVIGSLLENPLVMDLLRTANAEVLAAEERARATEARFEDLKRTILRLAETAAVKVAAAEARVSELESRLSSIDNALSTVAQTTDVEQDVRTTSVH